MEYILNYHECEMRKVAHIDMDGEISLFLEKIILMEDKRLKNCLGKPLDTEKRFQLNN